MRAYPMASLEWSDSLPKRARENIPGDCARGATVNIRYRVKVAFMFITLPLRENRQHNMAGGRPGDGPVPGGFDNEIRSWVPLSLTHVEYPAARDNFTEFGMPSSHSQLMWFVATYLAFFVIVRLHHGNSSCPWENLWKCTVIICWFLLAGTVSYSRVYLEYHTWAQVCWGALIGSLLACLWFCLTQFILTPLYPRIVSWHLSELLMLRDTTLIPNVMWFEYTSYRTESRNLDY
ncbi:hypothetical protein HPB51_020129 [Rhipicephalus microplus]|uniref:Dolichyldiphosphatase 1 n=1 Tax=Rhipicephalus microplus TaxID=6941 RepID=A0A9J6EJA5_RHIMP|nr:hypothetical protein HPB51_020129 [Rhipicephalus microplus]